MNNVEIFPIQVMLLIFRPKPDVSCLESTSKIMYHIVVACSNRSHFEAHDGFFRWLMKGIFNPYVIDFLNKAKLFSEAMFFIIIFTYLR